MQRRMESSGQAAARTGIALRRLGFWTMVLAMAFGATSIVIRHTVGWPGDSTANRNWRVPSLEARRTSMPDSAAGAGLREASAPRKLPEDTGSELQGEVDSRRTAGDDLQELAEVLFDGPDEALRLGAAWTLAHSGSPAAVAVLLKALAEMEDGELKETVASLVAGLRHPRLASVLFEAFRTCRDRTIERCAQAALVACADEETIGAIVRAFENAQTPEERSSLTELIRAIRNPDAVPVLMALGDRSDDPVLAPLAASAIEALATSGAQNAAELLLAAHSNATAERAVLLARAIESFSAPDARPTLYYAAQGNKLAPSDRTRICAIRALANYPDTETCAFLEGIAGTGNGAVSMTAVETLARIRERLSMRGTQ